MIDLSTTLGIFLRTQILNETLYSISVRNFEFLFCQSQIRIIKPRTIEQLYPFYTDTEIDRRIETRGCSYENVYQSSEPNWVLGGFVDDIREGWPLAGECWE